MSEPQAHIHLDEGLQITRAILPGDPARIDRILPFLEDARELAYNREYRSAAGTYHGVGILALSTGIGGASMAIAVEELRAIGVTQIIRIGSCGSLQPHVALGDLVIANGAVRDDGASAAYIGRAFPAVPNYALLAASVEAARKHSFAYHVGLVRSHDSFYTDQEEELTTYWHARGILGADMETAALFTIGALRGIRTASILNNVVVFTEDTSSSIGKYANGEALTAEGEKREIIIALEALTGGTSQ